jgi:lysozyme family protein
MTIFERAVAVVLDLEGGVSDDPADPGGATRYGVSLRYALSVGDRDRDGWAEFDLDRDGDVDADDIRALPRERAVAEYERAFWTAYQCGEFPSRLGVALFDGVVNMGRPAVRCLQEALGVEPDGTVGPRTLEAGRQAVGRVLDVLDDYLARRAVVYAGLSTFPRFGRGWMRRLFIVHRACLRLWT